MGALGILQIIMQLLPVAVQYGPEVVADFKALIATLSGGGNLTPAELAKFTTDWDAMRARLTAANADWENATH